MLDKFGIQGDGRRFEDFSRLRKGFRDSFVVGLDPSTRRIHFLLLFFRNNCFQNIHTSFVHNSKILTNSCLQILTKNLVHLSSANSSQSLLSVENFVSRDATLSPLDTPFSPVCFAAENENERSSVKGRGERKKKERGRNGS